MDVGELPSNIPDTLIEIERIFFEDIDICKFISRCAGGAYIASICLPDLTFKMAVSSQIVKPDSDALILFKQVNLI